LIQAQAQRNKYLETTIQTASPIQLLVMLCDGAVRFCKQGIEAMKNHQYEDANNYIVRVQNIVSEFVITLDRSSPMAEGLLKLYEYFNFRLIEANIKKDYTIVEEVQGYLMELKETWIQASKLAGSSATSGNKHG
jgi:flagellar protein FliS